MFKLSVKNFQRRIPAPPPQLTSTEQEPFSIEALSLSLKKILSCTDASYQNLYQNLSRHVGENSTFTHKNTLKALLKHLMHAIEQEPNASKKIGMAGALTTEISSCTNGFYDRVYSLYQSLQTNESFDDWLHDIRFELVERAARRASSDVHTHNRYFTIAAQHFGVTPLVSEDAYHGSIEDRVINQDLVRIFNQSYQPLNILTKLTTRFLELMRAHGINRLIAHAAYEQAVFDELLEHINLFFPHAGLDINTLIELNEEGKPVAIDTHELVKSIYLELARRDYVVCEERFHEPILKLIAHEITADELTDIAPSLFASNYLFIRDVFRYLPSLTLDQKINILKRAASALNPRDVKAMLVATNRYIESFDALCVHFPDILSPPLLISPNSIYRQEENYQFFLRILIKNQDFVFMQTPTERGYTLFNSLLCYPSTFEYCLDNILQIPQEELDSLVNKRTPMGKNFLHGAFNHSEISTESLNRLCRALSADNLRAFCEEVLEAIRIDEFDDIDEIDDEAAKFISELSPSKFHLFTQLCASVALLDELTTLVFPREQTILHVAVSLGCNASVRFLARNEALLHKMDEERQTALHRAAEKGYPEIVQTLLEHRADVDAPDEIKKTPLHIAAEKGNIEVVRLLIEKNATIDAVNDNRYTPLFLAILENKPQIVSYLLEHRADVNYSSANKETALHLAAIEEHVAIMKCLIEHGANPNAEDSYQKTALHYAVECENIEIIRYLLTQQASINIYSSEGNTPFHIAVYQTAFPIVELFIEHGVYINQRTSKGDTPLHVAIKENDFEMVEYLIGRGATLSARTTKGKTALHLAVIATDLPITACLLEHGARIDARDRNNATPLHYAVSKNNARIAELLTSKGARTNVRDSLGKTPLDIARIHQFSSLIELLEAATQSTKRPERPSLFRSASSSHKTEDQDEASPQEAKRHKH